MIRIAEATEFRGLALTGRNAPLQIAAETDDGELVEVFLKPSGRPELGQEGLANELLAACVAGQIGLPVCEPILVKITTAWVDTIPDATVRAVLGESAEIGFGSLSAGEGWRIWSSGDQVLGNRRAPALGIFAFDAFTGNDDRRAEKPNLLVRGDNLRIIDHELCFRIAQKLFPPVAPWTVGNLNGLTDPIRHILGAALKGDRLIDMAPLKPRWQSLSDDCLAEFEALIPVQWQEAAVPIAQAINHLKKIRDRIDDCLAEIQRVLA